MFLFFKKIHPISFCQKMKLKCNITLEKKFKDYLIWGIFFFTEASEDSKQRYIRNYIAYFNN